MKGKERKEIDMKKIAIIYGGKTGTTKKCAETLKGLIPEVCVFSVNEEYNLSDYDIIVFGSPIRMGHLDKGIRKVIKKNSEVLKNKRIALFICHVLPDYQKAVDDSLPSWFKEQAVLINSFGGVVQMEQAKGFTKLLIKIMQKAAPNPIKQIDEEAVVTFANKIKLFL